jgi:hypothetical protein
MRALLVVWALCTLLSAQGYSWNITAVYPHAGDNRIYADGTLEVTTSQSPAGTTSLRPVARWATAPAGGGSVTAWVQALTQSGDTWPAFGATLNPSSYFAPGLYRVGGLGSGYQSVQFAMLKSDTTVALESGWFDVGEADALDGLAIVPEVPTGYTIGDGPFEWGGVWTPPDDPQPITGLPPGSPDSIFYRAELQGAPGTWSSFAEELDPAARWPSTNGWPDGRDTAVAPVPPQQAGTYVCTVGYVYEGQTYELASTTFEVTGQPGEADLTGDGCGPYGLNWTDLDPALGPHVIQASKLDCCTLEVYYLQPSDYPNGSFSFGRFPEQAGGPYEVQVCFWGHGSDFDNPWTGDGGALCYELLVNCGPGDGGTPGTGLGDGTGAWDQPEIDDLLGRQAELVALAEQAGVARDAILSELQAIRLGLPTATGLTAGELQAILDASSVGAPTAVGTTVPSEIGTHITGSTPTTGFDASSFTGSAWVVPFELPGGETFELNLELDPSQQTGTWVASSETYRQSIRGLLVAVLYLTFGGLFLRVWRQY